MLSRSVCLVGIVEQIWDWVLSGSLRKRVRVTPPRRPPEPEDVISSSESQGPSYLLARWGPGSLGGAPEALSHLAPVRAGRPPCSGIALTFKEAHGRPGKKAKESGGEAVPPASGSFPSSLGCVTICVCVGGVGVSGWNAMEG